MAILDRPLFQRRATKDELRGYGIPAFANGGVVKMRNGGDPLGLFTPGGLGQKIIEDKKKKPKVMLSDIFGDTNIQDRIEPETAITSVVDENYKDKILRDLENSPTVTEQEPSTETTESIESDATDSARRLEAEEKGGGNKKDDEPKPVDDTEELKKKYLKESKLLKEILGDNKEMVKRQGFLQLAQFGLNLASAQGSNFLDKVAKSAKDPLNAFAELGRKAFEDERAIELMALEQVRSKEAADTEYERELAKEERQAKLAIQLKELGLKEAKRTDLDVFQKVFGEQGEQKYLDFLMGKFGETQEDQVLKLTNSLIDTGQYKGKEGEAKTIAQGIVDSVYDKKEPKPDPTPTPTDTNQGDIKTMNSGSDWENIKVGEQFVLPSGRTGTKTGNELTNYTLD